MPGGRPPKPIELKRRNGNPGKRALPAKSTGVALEPVNGIPPVPIDLSEHGRSAWATVWLGGQHWLSPNVDRFRVETVCRLIDELAVYQDHVARMGPILEEPITTPTGVEVGSRFVANPAVKMLRDAQKQLSQELSALGFDPTSRSNLGLAEVKKRSILETLGLGPQRVESGEEIIDAEVIDIAPDA